MFVKLSATEAGATMVEFAFVIGLLMMLLGLIVDLGVGLYRYTLLTYSVTEATREVLAYSGRSRDCSATTMQDIEQHAYDVATSSIRRYAGSNADQTYQFDLQITNGVLALHGSHSYRCYFSCQVLRDITFSTNAQIVLQNGCF